MNIIVAVVIAAIVAYVCYLIALAVPFLAGFATIIGLVVFLLALFGGYSNGWQFPRR